MTDNEITMTSAEFEQPKKRKAIYPHIVVGGRVDDPSYSIHWYDVEKGRMIEGYSSFSLKYVHEWLEEYFEVVEDDIEPLINRQKAEIAELESEIATLKHSNINLQELYYAQKEKVAKSKQKVIDVCRQLQTAKAEIERLQKAVEDKGGLILIETAKADSNG